MDSRRIQYLLQYTRFLLIGTRLVSLEKIGDNSMFGGENRGQNSLFFAYLWVLMQLSHRTLPKKKLFIKFLDKNKGQVLV